MEYGINIDCNSGHNGTWTLHIKDNCGGNELGIINIDSKCGRNGNWDIKDLMESGYLDLMEFGYQR